MLKRFKTLFGLFLTLLLALSIPLTTYLVQEGKKFLTKATYRSANILVDTEKIIGPIPQSFRALAQGGEESTPYTLSPVVNEISDLKPKYIRIDHIFDFYNIVSRNSDGSLNFDFSQLDVLVRDIQKIGALPFFSLSYMPEVLAKDGGVVSLPTRWDEWKLLVNKTVEHYSGREGFNLTDVYYEVWNEPDLFGRFTIGYGEKDYLTLYAFAARGAIEAQNTNRFYFGGPATTQALANWFNTLVNYCLRNNLPLDFLSWHFYGRDISRLVNSINIADQTLAQFSQKPIQKIISEWGFDSENNAAYDNFLGATYTLAGMRAVENRLDLLFTFEIKDPPPPTEDFFWGRWGILTHENVGKKAKPRYEALKLLNNLKGSLLEVTGGGTYVDGIAAKEGETIKLLLYNYDLRGDHYESVPVTFKNLPKGNYELRSISFISKTPQILTQAVSNGSFTTSVILTPNDIAQVELTKVSSLLTYTQGRLERLDDQSLELIQTNESPVFPLPETSEVSGSLSFWFKPYWSGSDDNLNYTFFTINGAGGQTLYGKTAKIGFTNSLVFGLKIGGEEKEERQVSLPIRDWAVNSWHNLIFTFIERKIGLEIDGKRVEKEIPILLLPQNELKLEVANGAIDELILTNDGRVVLERHFDGSTN